ncbi:MAG: DEAD/DEAH box helicase [Leptolyngbyaceae cyanobacterium SM1_1_3]|nr:DEAD/DEAH box helicase [Leptolyngbyaceae cyanobacterium SM1_1_3]NJN04449.1 DEAD/DEAH box helicase [Leptolyngbyaceae cyanobacterium RM1_1_2]NJO10056.1 DEAD/DEAH box helicase [Leptolyngbyaceae cyanobacterium SL_1_1]
MKILHGTWIPEANAGFVQAGAFYIWVETETKSRHLRKSGSPHPCHLTQPELATFLVELDINPSGRKKLEELITTRYFLLPTAEGAPLPSLELSRYLETDMPEAFDWQFWQVDCYPAIAYSGYASVSNAIRLLSDLHFIALYNLADVQLGSDLLFWYYYSQVFKQVILKDQYIPALKYRQLENQPSPQKSVTGKKSTGKKSAPKTETPAFEIHPGWELIGDRYEQNLKTYVEYMPVLCAAGFAEPTKQLEFYEPETLLRHFSEYLLHNLITHTPSTVGFDKQIADSLLQSCLRPGANGAPWNSAERLEQYRQWQGWRDRISRSQTATPFHLCFQLQEPQQLGDAWEIQFQVAPKYDPSLRVALLDYWRMQGTEKSTLQQHLGEDFEQHLLMNLGYAARIYPGFWQGLETDQPVGIFLTLETAFEFLKESAWVLEDAGYKVIIPAWWTPQGRQRAKVRLKASGKSLSSSDPSKSYFSLDTLVQYQYDLAIGDQSVSQQEWQQLVDAKVPLVQFRGQWMELNQDKMQQMLTFWQTQQQENPELSLLEIMKLSAEGEDDLEVEFERDSLLSNMLTQLNDKSRLSLTPDPARLQGNLRDYQKRGLSWLHYLESLGLNGCLADDMGLGKTVQVIARLVQERELATKDGQKVPPTLLICPTSVVGNWYHELQKFAPHLQAVVHHGSDRPQETKDFKAACRSHDVMLTSFTLARKDAKLFNQVTWHRLVLDEAQNIKNPKAAQTKAILKLAANHRLALTGTPVENRLMDLWSIFNFLNPGYLGKQTQFRKQFELPIQKNNDLSRSAMLKKLVEPFILRRVKTDASIIKDLPDKVEQKLFCNLTQEQASLYEVVIKDISGQLEAAEGIQRKGMMLATLMKLKQICNHPRQFLQDESEFTPGRSHKLSRLLEMLSEVMAEGESALVFTQFREIGNALERYLRQTCHYPTHYIHGGTSRQKREQMIAQFQDPETDPSIFILSLKAGGVGITLTKANHVFHFDRWWNPAVEDQATDRAFRIGQQKNVFVHKFVAIGTLEERIDKMIEDKKKLAGAIVGADESWLTELDNNSFKQLIALNQKAILE